jgi:hypothetical protein
MLRKFLFILSLFIFSISIYAQKSVEKKTFHTQRKTTVNKENTKTEISFEDSESENFIQMQPNAGNLSEQKTAFKVEYDNTAIYIYAMLYDSQPDSIDKQLTKRDDSGTADYFAVLIDPYNDEQLGYGFIVTTAGVQSDLKFSKNNQDASWDAVWKSETRVLKNGWQAEIKIPYSALRFPNKKIQTWGINFYRYLGRNRELSSWNPVNPSTDNLNLGNGELTGIENIESPVRLSLSPFLAAYAEKYDSEKNSYSVRGGMDLKYGISESFTLDMMLIPDFGQVQSDDKQLNLSPFELYYNENRPFFTEGTELFQRANIFYSRRIGGMPRKYYDMSDSLKGAEKIDKNPSELQLLNATKISGKTKNGFSLGFLNGMSQASNAVLKDSITGETRKINTQQFTNYNVFVAEQSLKNNSHISLINTNYFSPKSKYTANVTGADFSIQNKNNSYSISGNGALSQIADDTLGKQYGQKFSLSLNKISGNFKFSISHQTISDKFNPNDMGYLQVNNRMIHSASVSYQIYKPVWRLLNWHVYLGADNTFRFSPRHYIGTNIYSNGNCTFKNRITLGYNFWLQPDRNYNFDEPRIEGMVFNQYPGCSAGAWLSTDYSKTFAGDIGAGHFATKHIGAHGFWFFVAPRWRANDKLMLIYNFNGMWDYAEIGYAGTSDDGTVSFFGRRDQKTIVNLLTAQFTLNNHSSFSLRARHYWAPVAYQKFYELMPDGEVSNQIDFYSTDNINFNSFNVDFIYSWEFAPGSFVTAAWKNQIFTDAGYFSNSFFANLKKTFASPETNNVSIKVLYYFDYGYLKRK